MKNLHVASLVILFLQLISCLTLASKSPDPSVPDDSDLNIIDEWINSEKKKNDDKNNPNPSRDSLGSSGSTVTPTGIPSSDGSNIIRNEKGEPCRCVKYYLCEIKEETTTISTTSTTVAVTETPTVTPDTTDAGTESSQNILGVVDIRSGINYTCPGGDFDVCCALKDIKEESTPSTTTTTTTTPGSVMIPPTPSSRPAPPYTRRHHCGHRNENGIGPKVVGTGQEAQFGEFPWTAAIIHLEKNEDNFTILKYVGGGSLLHPQVVLTVAHNVLGKSRANLKVRLGEWDTQTNEESFPSQDRGVKKVIVHELFLKKTLYNDVALLILDEEVKFAPNVDTICLPPVPKRGMEPLKFEGQMCYSAGWGKDQLGAEGRYSDVMKKVQVPVVSHDSCQRELQKSEKLPGFRLDKSFMCAGGNGEDTCKGDGGSPLVCSVRGGENGEEDGEVHYIQVGAVSWGLGCKSSVYPGVYADIQYLTPWILKTMEKEEMSTEYCTFQ